MADADAIEAAARAAGVLVVCSPPNMIYPSRREARRLVEDGAVGQVALAKVRASHAGPAAMSWPLDPGAAAGGVRPRGDTGPALQHQRDRAGPAAGAVPGGHAGTRRAARRVGAARSRAPRRAAAARGPGPARGADRAPGRLPGRGTS